MSDDIKDPEEMQAEALDKACSGAFFFQGKRLHKFSFMRQSAAQRLNIDQDSLLESWVLLVYLCTLGPESISGTTETGIDRIDKARGEAGCRLFRRQMEEWADGCGISFGSDAAREVREIATSIWEDLFRSKVEPVVSGGSAKKKRGKP